MGGDRRPTERPRERGAIALACASALLLAGCPVGPDFVRPAPPKGAAYLHGTPPAQTAGALGAPQRFRPGAALPADWWRLFHCRGLDALEAEALARDPTLEAARASLTQSQALLTAGYGVFFPQLGGGASAAREQFNPKAVGLSFPPIAFNLFTLSAQVSYALDVFGGGRRQVEALGAQVDSQREAYRAAVLTVTGDVALAVIARAGYAGEAEETRGLVAAEREQLALAQDQARAGIGSWLAVDSLQVQLSATLASLPPLEQRIDQSDHLLATLVGRAPADFAPPEIALDDLALPRDVPVALPADLVRRRPDVLAAEAQLHAANAQIGVATAALLPRFTLSPSVGLQSSQITALFSPDSVVWSLGAGLTAPLFEGGALWFQRKAAIAARDQAAASYRQTVLAALAQVADALRALAHDADVLAAQDDAVRAADAAYRLTDAGLRSGAVSYVQLLVADAQRRQARVGRAAAAAVRLQDTVALFTASGGGGRPGD